MLIALRDVSYSIKSCKWVFSRLTQKQKLCSRFILPKQVDRELKGTRDSILALNVNDFGHVSLFVKSER